ncbi:hypothetical protein GRAN_0992 [Granulicella sibirica]|uniref:Uncharacterized protein n=1 Tax=Granulicella sibirica TaxID=2479048 RepID=A0A4Q0T428_9BACT|nr:hypothetical protein GRAN_0992 [Granulicella sibirica]
MDLGMETFRDRKLAASGSTQFIGFGSTNPSSMLTVMDRIVLDQYGRVL